MTNQQRHETRDVDQEVSLSPLDFGHVGHVLRRTRATDRARLELAGDSSAQGESNTGGSSSSMSLRLGQKDTCETSSAPPPSFFFSCSSFRHEPNGRSHQRVPQMLQRWKGRRTFSTELCGITCAARASFDAAGEPRGCSRFVCGFCALET